jgi:two-component sensor histidine kinase
LTNAELAKRNEELQALYGRVERDAAVQAILRRELNHRVRNNLAAILGVLEIERERAHLRTADEALEACMTRLHAIARVHDILATDSFGAGELRDFLDTLAGGISSAAGCSAPRLEIAYDQVSLRLPPKPFLALACIVHELILNAAKHAFRGRRHGRIQIQVREEGEHYILEVRDDGAGMAAEAVASGAGLQIVATLCHTDLRGECQFLQDGGTIARIIFPKAIAADGGRQ